MSDEQTRNMNNSEKIGQILVLVQNNMNVLQETRSELRETRSELRETRSELQELSRKQDLLEEKVERRLQETRPIWEAVLARLDKLETGVVNLKEEVAHGFRKLEKKIGLITEDLLDVRTEQRLLEIRVDKLESKPQ
jgi:hypothetical protein